MNYQSTAPPVWRPRRLFWGMIFVLVLLVGLTALALTLFATDWLEANRQLAVNLHSPLNADYSADPRGFLIPAVNVNLIAEIVRDRPGAADPGDPLATVVVVLQTPVPTVTPLFTPTSGGLLPTSPPPAATATLGPVLTATLTVTGTPTATGTIERTVTRQATPTGVLSTRTPAPPSVTPFPATPTRMPPTATPLPPTATLLPTFTWTPVTPTSIPPSPTPNCGGGGYPPPPGCPTSAPYPSP